MAAPLMADGRWQMASEFQARYPPSAICHQQSRDPPSAQLRSAQPTGGTVVETVNCPECHAARTDPSVVCPDCGAPPVHPGDQRGAVEEVREHDLEPYVTLRYIARLFKILAALMVIMLIGEIVTGLSNDLPSLIGEITKTLVLAGLMWGGGDLTMLMIDAGHDLRVARILLGRINAELHRKANEK